MRTTLLLSVASLALSTGACKKKDADKVEPAVAPKVTDKTPKEPPKAPAAGADMSVTSKNKDAIAELEKGRDLMDGQRQAEAKEHIQKAVDLDPTFALARAYLGFVTEGSAGGHHLDKAVELAKTLPEAEREFITGGQAMRNGDANAARAAFEKVLAAAPGAWRVDMLLGNMANGTGDQAGAIKRFEHALSLKPDLAQAQNGLAYSHAALGEWDPAIAAAKKQVELLPKEPNPADTLGEVLLWSGKYDESEQAFQAAIKLEPKFAISWQGIGLARAYKGDTKGALEAFAERGKSTDPVDKLEALIDSAWVKFSEDKAADAMGFLDQVEKDPAAKDLPIYAFVNVDRAVMLSFTGKYADARKALDTAASRSAPLAGAGQKNLANSSALVRLEIAAQSGKADADADKLVAQLDGASKETPDDKSLASMTAWAHGLAAWAKTGAKDAVVELSKCTPEILGCRHDLAAAQRKAGDAAGADATEKQLKGTPRREAMGVYLLSHLGGKPAAPAKK